MKIGFTALGLLFEAELHYAPGIPSCGGLDPPDPPELEYLSLTCGGQDASFLYESAVWPAIDDAAFEAALRQEKADRRAAVFERQADRAAFTERGV